jgi:hypothetical protein
MLTWDRLCAPHPNPRGARHHTENHVDDGDALRAYALRSTTARASSLRDVYAVWMTG